MALPSYTPTGQRIFYYLYIFFCSVVFFFLIAPLVAIVPISFSISPFMVFTEGMMTWPPDPDAWSLRWYRYMVGIYTDKKFILIFVLNSLGKAIVESLTFRKKRYI